MSQDPYTACNAGGGRGRKGRPQKGRQWTAGSGMAGLGRRAQAARTYDAIRMHHALAHSRIRISAASIYAVRSGVVGKNQKYGILTGRITRWGLVSCACLLYEQRQRSIRPVGKGLSTG